MRVLEVVRPGLFHLGERPSPSAGAGEALLRPLAVGICGSDLDLVQGTRPAAYVSYPIVPGHEWVAEVVDLGAGVTHIAPGAYVAVEGHHYCRICAQCRRGATNLCEHYDEFGCTRDGGLAELVVARGDLLHPFRRAIPPEVAALTEPTACALHGVEMAIPQPGETIVVIGPGTIGLLATALFALSHPRRLIVVGRHATNREIALSLGATDFIIGTPEEVSQAVAELTDGKGADIVYEAAGHVSAMHLALDLARRGGRVIYEGVAGETARLSVAADCFLLKALHVHGIFAYTSVHFERALRLIEESILKVAPLITHRLPLDRYADGIKLLEKRTERVVKISIFPQEERL
jgi:threonine dehydrogenase-like Zn-dependent dehydrogenase